MGRKSGGEVKGVRSPSTKFLPKRIVRVDADEGWLRLRFSHQGKRYALTLHLPDPPVNRQISEGRAKQIEGDIVTGNFDPTLRKYRPERQLDMSTLELWRKFAAYKKGEITPRTFESTYKPVDGHLHNFGNIASAKDAQRFVNSLRFC